jgi:Glycosyl transferase family 2
MRLLATLLVRDEEEILRPCVDYHLAQGVDQILVMDNGSTDSTPAILREYEKRGVVRVIPGAEPGQYRQAEWVTKMARVAYNEYGADWVLHLDADEFWWPTAGGTLPDVLASVPDEFGVVNVTRVDFDPAPSGPQPFWERMTVRRRILRTPLGNRGLPRVAHRGNPDIEISAGNHSAAASGIELAPPIQLIEALHFPTRSYDQLERKVAAHAENLRATAGLKEDIGEETLSLDDRRRAGTLRAYFDSRIVDEVCKARGLADGWLVNDDRLSLFFAAGLYRRAAQPSVTDHLSEQFQDITEWLSLRLAASRSQVASLSQRLDDAAAHMEGASSRIRTIEEAYNATDVALRAERQAHFETAEALRLLRNSRAVRFVRRLRRLLPRFEA